MSAEACCTCAALFSSIPPPYTEEKKKPQYERRLACCGRAICPRCIANNPRFATYCPFCQISTVPSPLPPQGLREPPSYSPPSDEPRTGTSIDIDPELPPYSASNPLGTTVQSKGKSEHASDVLHFVDPGNDSITSLSLRYGVPAEALKRKNGLFAGHLLPARRTILIPGEYYKGGVSLSPRPLEGEEEEIRKSKIRKWMLACKVAEYDVALLYLQQADYNLEQAIEAYRADESWEKDHPLEAARKGKADSKSSGRRGWGFGGGGLTGQLS
ncbi:hypothetical protein GQ43DRAFT_193184 [Delitschia confertaspora ATCC 74209]|uniref:LysM domain-containing protein n=1 Tax=Delitschia confertaspora ATCC 74209 TaxID=1513339 RepID=A0A9P4MS68_9PLEO|nr:hypothetical protein GQ43DRAFT_193184 [Delitschia confertaspora ATCC 74209]